MGIVLSLLKDGELGQNKILEALDNPIGVRAVGLSPGMIDILHREIQLVFMAFGTAAIFRAPIGEHALWRNLLRIEKRELSDH